VTSPPSTAVTRVDLRLQNAIVTGETNSATAVESAPSQPASKHVKLESLVAHLIYMVILTCTRGYVDLNPTSSRTGSVVPPDRNLLRLTSGSSNGMTWQRLPME